MPRMARFHLGEPPRRVVRLLAVDGDVAACPAAVAIARGVRADELDRLHEHAGGAAAGIVDPAPVWLQHLDQELDDAARGVELASLLALGARELGQEVLVELGRSRPFERASSSPTLMLLIMSMSWPSRCLSRAGRTGLSRSIAAIASSTSWPMVGCLAWALRWPQRASRGTQKMLTARYSSGSSGSAPGSCFAFQAGVPLLECVGDVLEEDQAEDDVLVLGCIHRAPQGVGHAPEFGLIPGSRALGGGSSVSLGFLLSRSGLVP